MNAVAGRDDHPQAPFVGDEPTTSVAADQPEPTDAADARPSTGRRELTYAVLLCLTGAGLAVWAATRTWSVEVTARPAPLPALREEHSGAALLPWLPALAVVALAAAGAVLATRGLLRRVVGLLVLLLGTAVAVGGGYALAAGFDGEVSRQWPAFCLVGGVLAAAGGAWTALRGATWPAMGARYERRTGGGVATSGGAGAASTPGTRGTTEVWDALDRGEDPTLS